MEDPQKRISFMGANYVAQQVGYHMAQGWGEGDSSTNAYFRPIETFAQRFEALLLAIRGMGFSLMDLWMAQLNWSWATPEHVTVARDLLQRYDVRIVSLAGYFGTTKSEFEAACSLARDLDVSILGGSTGLLADDRASTVAILKQYGVRLGIENHPAEKTAQDMLDLIGDGGDGFIGTAVDTGWYATNGYDAVRAIEELYPHLVYVHLKDVLAPGAHDTCRYGQGCVDIPKCVETLERLGYQGVYSIEHEPEHFDPTEDCIAMREMLLKWLTQA
jgi:L-ribulose-5-phosphate 3-epimerase